MDLLTIAQLCADFWFPLQNVKHYEHLPFILLESYIALNENPKLLFSSTNGN